MNFKRRVAEIMSSHCQRMVREERDCQMRDNDRARRSRSAVVFTAADVYIPPGYPRQSATSDGILLAFFIIRPDSADDFVPFPVDSIMLAVRLNQPQLQQSLGNKHIILMKTYEQYLHGATVPPNTRTTPSEGKPPGNPQDSEILQVSVSTATAALAVIALFVSVIVCVKKNNGKLYRVEEAPPSSRAPELPYMYDESVKRLKATKDAWGVDNPIIIKS
ncbi:PREDICTED: uncharacterized protein LOC109464364 [Branchiostoma belcheri]|uniref:Uncharacterized protein LOC109464364 n=1 Tax=Branchiostoma belcheri TaxID=7741 RepID=A0A6P4YIL5_BRABE|nr:PREDICTED: uncharacterized protein LOC109464364 [Branchiostoma belcheri]